MDDALIRALEAINRRFYAAHADAFSATRDSAWPGFAGIAEQLVRAGIDRGARVLDAGCGNGRYGRFLAERIDALDYVGLDASEALLEHARALPLARGGAARYERVDLVRDAWEARLGPAPFDHAALISVLHHVPGAPRRLALLERVCALLRPGALLAVSSWELTGVARVAERVIPWSAYNAGAAEPIDPAGLEPGDALLPWGRGEGVRYFHVADEAEMRALLAPLPARLLTSFCADGREARQNRYFVLERSAAPCPAGTP